MGFESRIQKTYRDSLNLPLKPSSRYAVFSDCHRGTGKANDNFLQDEYLYLAALRYYFQRGFAYIELGDGDELWENRSMKSIKENHKQSYEMLSMFYMQKRFYGVYGNHELKNIQSFLKSILIHSIVIRYFVINHSVLMSSFIQGLFYMIPLKDMRYL